jgi:hypothetical protein
MTNDPESLLLEKARLSGESENVPAAPFAARSELLVAVPIGRHWPLAPSLVTQVVPEGQAPAEALQPARHTWR